jgi:dTDP-4-amino-4,6-dideoxygalactose transaminase
MTASEAPMSTDIETKMDVPLLDLNAQFRTIEGEVRAAIDGVLESQHFIMGPEVKALEGEIAAYSDARFGVGVSSGTDALLVALMAAGVGPGDEVVTTTYSFFATAGVVSRLGATPVFVDIDPATFNMDAEAAARAINDRTRAVIPVHLYGRCADMDPVIEAAMDRGVIVLEDAAQAIGARDAAGRRAGSVGDMGAFSFFPSKNLGGFGDGGMVVTSDEALNEKLRILRVHGARPKYYHHVVGGNFRLDALQAAILRVKLRHLDGWTEARRANADLYRELFADAGLEDVVTVPTDVPGHIYNQFVIRVPRRDELAEHLSRSGVGTAVYYPVPFHMQGCFKELGYAEGDFPHAEKAAREVLAVPIYPELTREQQAYVVGRIGEFYRS